MLAIELPEEMEARLDALAKSEGRTKASYAFDVLLEHLGDLELTSRPASRQRSRSQT